MNLQEIMQDSRVVMRGNLREFNVASVLQVLSISRQFTAVEFLLKDAETAGRVYLKSGVVVFVEVVGSPVRGVEAFNELMRRRLRFFKVYRLAPLDDYPAPVGQLSSLLLQCPSFPDIDDDDEAPQGSAQAVAAEASQPQSSQAQSSQAQSSQPQSSQPQRPTRDRPTITPVEEEESHAHSEITAEGLPAQSSASRRTPAQPVSRDDISSSRPPAPPATSRPAPHIPAAPAPATPIGSLPALDSPALSSPALSVEPSPPAAVAPGRVIAISSPKGGCGKTTIALNLAVSLARAGFRVVLVDSDPNGDVLSAIAARDRVQAGAFDVLADAAEVEPLILKTIVPNLRILPAMGPEFPLRIMQNPPHVEEWKGLFAKIHRDADIVVVDTAAGMFGITGDVLRACNYVVGVLQAEVIPKRSFEMFQKALEAMAQHPEVLGVVLNMFRRNQGASVSVLAEAAEDLPTDWLFQTTIPRADAFLESNEAGMPLRMLSEDAAPAVTWLFDMLAGEVRDRLGIKEPEPERPVSFLA